MIEFMKLARHMLRLAGAEFGGHGCNDFSLEGHLSHEQQVSFVTAAHRLNGDPENTASSVSRLPFVPDFVVMITLGLMLSPR